MSMGGVLFSFLSEVDHNTKIVLSMVILSTFKSLWPVIAATFITLSYFSKNLPVAS